MFITKIIGVILTVSSSAAIGFYFSTILKDRIEDLKELKKLMIVLKGDIRYANTPLPEAIEAIAKRQEGNYQEFFEYMANELSERSGITFYEIWKKAVQENLMKTSLNKKDKENLSKLGENLGYLDKEMQLSSFDLYLEQLDEEIEDAVSNVKEKSKLYNVLGLMCGIFITIVII